MPFLLRSEPPMLILKHPQPGAAATSPPSPPSPPSWTMLLQRLAQLIRETNPSLHSQLQPILNAASNWA